MAKIQADWPKNLEQFISDYPTSPDAAEAMLQLGIAREYAGQDDDAKKWYERIGREFADSPQAKKAAGAARRIDSVGTRPEPQRQGPRRRNGRSGRLSRQGGAHPVLGNLVRVGQERHAGPQAACRRNTAARLP